MDTTTATHLKEIACDAIDKFSHELTEISEDIWKHPEESFQEHHAHQVLTDYLEKHNFPVERNYVSDTGFKSIYGGDSGPNVAVLCEYDCLPEIGHACGHNLIAEAGIGAAIGIKAALDASKEAGQQLGKLTVLGTPAEESGGGKIQMIRAGVFSDVDVAMMVHPAHVSVVSVALNARQEVTVRYSGRASHAAGFPWQGINALDAAVMAYNGISVLRQQMKPDWRIHGVISNGGAKPNIIPESSQMVYYVRAPTIVELKQLKEKATACFQAAADATGCKVDLDWESEPYYNMINNPILATLYSENVTAKGVKLQEDSSIGGGSSDMGNVSQVVPSIHPVFDIGTDVGLHSRLFTDASGSPLAQSYTLTQAKVLAMTAIDVYLQPQLVPEMKAALAEQLQCQQQA